MKQIKLTAKKTLSLLLTVALLLPALALYGTAADKTPIVYVHGDNSVYVTKDDGTMYVPRDEYADGLIAEAVPELAPEFAKAVLTNDYTEWGAKALEAIAPIYDPIRPNPDGSLPEGTGILWSWSPETLAPDYRFNSYEFWWDPRRSPLDVADDLNDYIQAVKARDNVDKVVLASCCAGTGEAAAYLVKYGTQDVEKVIFAGNSLHGFDFADLALSGNITISGTALYRYLLEYDLLGGLDNEIEAFIMATLKYMNKDASTEEILDLILNLYDKIGDCFIAPFLRQYVGISLGYVATVDKHFEDYKNYVFPTEELKTEYAPFIAKAEEFHETVQKPLDEMLQEMNANGVPVYFIASYGEQGYPIGELSDYVGDELQSVYLQSFGATAAKMTETLDDKYIAEQTEKALGKYISPDKQIDASTCMFPDQTWFIKNMRHFFKSDAILTLLDAIANKDDITVDTLEAFPQYLNCLSDFTALEPAKPINENDIDWASLESSDPDFKISFFAGVVAFFAKIIAFFNRIIRFFKQTLGIEK